MYERKIDLSPFGFFRRFHLSISTLKAFFAYFFSSLPSHLLHFSLSFFCFFLLSLHFLLKTNKKEQKRWRRRERRKRNKQKRNKLNVTSYFQRKVQSGFFVSCNNASTYLGCVRESVCDVLLSVFSCRRVSF